MNILKALTLLALILSAAQFVHAADTPRSPEEQAVIEAEAKATAARKAVEEKKAIEAARKKADWNSKSLGEAWAIRGQAVVDAAQYAAGTGAAYAGGFDSEALRYGVEVPAVFVVDGLRSIATASAAYAKDAYNNEVKNVAVKTETAKPEQK